MAAGQRSNFPYDLFQVKDYVANSPKFLARKTVYMSDENGLLIPEEVKVFLTYPFPNFDMDALSGTGIPVLVQTTVGNINCVVKQGRDPRCKKIFGWPQVRDALDVGVASTINIFDYHAPIQIELVIVLVN